MSMLLVPRMSTVMLGISQQSCSNNKHYPSRRQRISGSLSQATLRMHFPLWFGVASSFFVSPCCDIFSSNNCLSLLWALNTSGLCWVPRSRDCVSPYCDIFTRQRIVCALGSQHIVLCWVPRSSCFVSPGLFAPTNSLSLLWALNTSYLCWVPRRRYYVSLYCDILLGQRIV